MNKTNNTPGWWTVEGYLGDDSGEAWFTSTQVYADDEKQAERLGLRQLHRTKHHTEILYRITSVTRDHSVVTTVKRT